MTVLFAMVALVMGTFLILFHATLGYLLIGAAFVIVGAGMMRRDKTPTRGGYVIEPYRPRPAQGESYRVNVIGGWLWHEYDNGSRVLIGPAPEPGNHEQN